MGIIPRLRLLKWTALNVHWYRVMNLAVIIWFQCFDIALPDAPGIARLPGEQQLMDEYKLMFYYF